MWIHIPSSACTQESGDLTSELDKQSQLPHLLTSKGKLHALAYWQKELAKDYLTRLRSTLMLSPSQQNSLLEGWMESSVDFHASPLVLPEDRKDPRTSEISGQTPSGSFAHYDQDSHSWRTFQVSFLTSTLEPFSESFPKQGTMRSGVVSKPLTLAHHTDESDSSSWPTPRTSDTEGGPETNVEMKEGSFSRTNKEGVRWGVKLKDAVANWPTPASRDHTDGQGRNGIRSNTRRSSHKALADSSIGRYREPSEEVQAGGNASEHGNRTVADSEHLRPIHAPPHGQSRHGEIATEGGGNELADSDSDGSPKDTRDDGEICGLSEEDRQQEYRTTIPGGSGGNVADSDSSRGREDKQQTELRTAGTEQPSCNSRGSQAREDDQVERGRDGDNYEPGQNVGNANSTRTQGRHIGTYYARERTSGQTSTELDKLPEFPPGPGEPDWGWVIEHFPELAPATCKHGASVRHNVHETESDVCCVDDAWQIKDRVAALMMLGNAVVPDQAEMAFRVLASRIK